MSRVYLAAVGNANDPITWSGIPYHFLQAAQTDDLINEGLNLSTAGAIWKARRLLWNFAQLLSGHGAGGYQYSVSFLERLWAQQRRKLKDSTIINCFQLYPPSVVAETSIRKFYYIDMTLKQLFRDYALEKTIGKVILRDALQRELEGYQAAEWVVCHSQWAAESVMREYAIPAAKIRTIVPGANIDFVVFQHWYNTASMHLRQPHEPLRLLFIGKYWDRKGLDRLLETLLILQQKTRQVKLQVMGCDRNTLPVHLQNLPDVEWLGFVNKRTDTERFLQITGNADVGCLLSRAEAGGMVLREYHALGLIVMGPDVGGAPEHLFSDAGKAFPPESSAEEIANWIYTLATDYELYRKLRVRAWEKRQRATWETSVKQWREILPRNR